MNLLIRVIGSAVAVAALAACQKALSEAKFRPLATLAGTEWKPAEGTGSDQFIAFKANGEVSGSGGCNSFFGSFEQNGSALTFGPLAATRKACPSAQMMAEREFLDRLADVRSVEATHAELRLMGANGETVLLMRRRG